MGAHYHRGQKRTYLTSTPDGFLGACSFQARKRNPNPSFWVRISSGGVGVFHVKGRGPKSSVCPSKPAKSNFLRYIPGFCRDIRGVPGKFEKKKFGFNFRSLLQGGSVPLTGPLVPLTGASVPLTGLFNCLIVGFGLGAFNCQGFGVSLRI